MWNKYAIAVSNFRSWWTNVELKFLIYFIEIKLGQVELYIGLGVTFNISSVKFDRWQFEDDNFRQSSLRMCGILIVYDSYSYCGGRLNGKKREGWTHRFKTEYINFLF